MRLDAADDRFILLGYYGLAIGVLRHEISRPSIENLFVGISCRAPTRLSANRCST